MKGDKKSLSIHGIINVVIHFPVLIATSFWGLLIIGIFNLDSTTDPFWYAVTMFPLLIPPASCVAGIIRGAIHFRKYKSGPLCLILSIVGLIVYIGMIVLCGWLGSIA